jgi:hypothetical protein
VVEGAAAARAFAAGRDRWPPRPRILHPWPSQRFAVKHPRCEPCAGKPHVRLRVGRSVVGVPTAFL